MDRKEPALATRAPYLFSKARNRFSSCCRRNLNSAFSMWTFLNSLAQKLDLQLCRTASMRRSPALPRTPKAQPPAVRRGIPAFFSRSSQVPAYGHRVRSPAPAGFAIKTPLTRLLPFPSRRISPLPEPKARRADSR